MSFKGYRIGDIVAGSFGVAVVRRRGLLKESNELILEVALIDYSRTSRQVFARYEHFEIAESEVAMQYRPYKSKRFNR